MKRDAANQRLFTRRALFVGVSQVVLVSALVARMYDLQVVQSDQYKVLADENRINLRLLPPPRGRILDRNGVEIATNQQNYRVVLIAEQTKSVERTIDSLGKVIPITPYERTKIMRDVSRNRSFVPVTVAENLSWDQFAAINVNSPDLPGLQPEIGETRHYPMGDAMSHVVGYVAAVAEADLGEDPMLQLPGFRIGKSGIERIQDKELRGKAGVSRVEVNAFGRVIRELTRRDGQPGEDVTITLDSELQRFAVARLAGESGAVVVMDVRNGDVLTLASTPGFDPQPFNIGLNQRQWQALTGDPRNPLVNKALSGQFPPGSTFKMMVAIAALESGLTRDHSVFCNGALDFGSHTFHCWKKHGHGTLSMVAAMEHSCDIYFYDVARRVGIDKIAEIGNRFGLGKPTGLGLPAEKGGVMPTRDWKLATMGEAWQQGETLIAGIGQGFVLTTPLQLAVMTARLATGLAVKPRLLHPRKGEAAPEIPPVAVSAAALALAREGMYRVSNSPSGTAYLARITNDPEFLIAGKTGTSQVRRITRYERETRVLKNDELPWIERDHAVFVAFAPHNDPRYAISVLVEHGGGGSAVAAPIARDVLRELRRLEKLPRQPARPMAAEPAPGAGTTRG